MKKGLLALAMLLLLGLAQTAFAAPGDRVLFPEIYSDGMSANTVSIQSVAASGDMVYMHAYSAIYTYKLGDAEPVCYAIPQNEDSWWSGRGETLVTGDDGALYALDTGSGMLRKVSFEGGALRYEDAVQLDVSLISDGEGENRYLRSGRGGAIVGGALYMPVMTADYADAELFAFSMTDGSCRKYDVKNVKSFAAYKDGMGLLGLHDDMEGWNDPMKLAVIDLESGAVTELCTLGEKSRDAGGFVYDAASDAIYYASDSVVWRKVGSEEPVAVTAMPVSSYSEQPGFLLGNSFVMGGYGGVAIRNVDPSYQPTGSLNIRNSNVGNTQGYYDFLESHPDVNVVLSSGGWESDSVTKAMMNKSSEVDIYSLSASTTAFQSMYKRDYIADLSSSHTLTDLVAAMYPQMQNVLTKDGKLCAVPSDLYIGCFGYNAKAFEKVGLTEADVPKTFAELFALVDRWQRDFASNYPEMSIFEPYMMTNMKEMLLSQVLSYYSLSLDVPGAEVRFDTQVFRDLLAAFEQVDFSQYDVYEEQDSYSYDSNNILLTTYMSLTPSTLDRGDGAYTPMPLSLAEGMDPMYSAYLNMLVVNPFSENYDTAVAFLESFVGGYDDVTLAMMCPERNDEIPNPGYDAIIENWEKQKQNILSMYDKADEADKQALQEQIDYFDEVDARYAELKMAATKESLAAYRAQAAYIVVNRQSAFGEQNYEDISDLTQRYLHGQMPASQFISAIDQKVRMMMMEDA